MGGRYFRGATDGDSGAGGNVIELLGSLGDGL